MSRLELHLSNVDVPLSVRRFVVSEALSGLFEVSVWARSSDEALDLAAIVGQPATFRIDNGVAHAARGERTWSGVVSAMEHEQAEETGLSTYRLRIVPRLWLLTQRRNYRIFQHASAPEIVRRVLAEWQIEGAWNVDAAQHPKLEYRVQHGETDEAFVRRILEEAGISFLFTDDEGSGSALVFSDALHAYSERAAGPLPYVDNPRQSAERDFVTDIRVLREVRPGKVILGDHDFRSDSGYRATVEAVAPGGDIRLEHYRYEPGGLLTEGHRAGETPLADQHGVARIDERSGRRQAEARRFADEAQRSRITFRTNALDLRPGRVFCAAGHPRPELSAGKRLLVTSLSIEGTHDGEWTADGRAAFAAHPYRPPRVTPKPTLHSVESAIVVGPPGQEIHTDEHGRVRVQFHWDRSDSGEHSSCWMRVSQGWAGGAFGMLALPRVGHEVLVAFLGGDPDQPIVVGRVFNGSSPVPYKLPEHKTRSTWRSDSSPGSGGFNEIMFEDARGRELVYMQAERDHERLVKADERITVGHSRVKRVGRSETETIGADHTMAVGMNRFTSIGGADETTVGQRHAVSVAAREGRREHVPPTGMEMVDRKITLTTGEATLTLEGPNITLDAAASLLLSACADITVTGRANIHIAGGAHVLLKSRRGDLVVQGGPDVFINPGADAELDPAEIPVDVPLGLDIGEELVDAEDFAMFDSREPEPLRKNLAAGGVWDPLQWGRDYEEFGFFRLGMVAAAAGIPLGVMARQMGKRDVARRRVDGQYGDAGNGVFGGRAPYGNDPDQYELMARGAGFYTLNYGRGST